MNFKLISLVCFITTFLFIFTASSVQLAWDPSPDSTVTGYKIYWGGATHSYSNVVDVGNVTNVLISNTNFIPNNVYYFAATAYDTNTESDFSNEAIWTYVPIIPLNIIYVGVRVDYGVSLTSINSKQVMVMAVTNQPGYFYNESLIITNNPFVGIRPSDGNNYIYLGTTIQYGGSLTTLTNATFPLITFTNPPAYYYRSVLILTNNPF